MITKRQFHDVINDIFASFLSIRAVLFFANSDLKARYKRSFLGPFWIVLTTSIGVVGLGYLWSAILKQKPSELIPSLTYGLVVWQFISGSITESSGIFVRNSNTIRNIKTPYFLFVLIGMSRHLMNFLHNCVIVFVVYMIYSEPNAEMVFYSFLGLAILLLNLFWINALVGCIGARFRDIEPLISSVMPIIFFLSPVIYRANNLGPLSDIVWYNPFSYFISVIRDPLLGYTPDSFVYYGTLAMTIFGFFITILMFSKYKSRLAFWV